MTLREYLTENGIVHSFFARKMGVTTTRLSLWLSGRSLPRLESIVQIEKMTKGAVKTEDWITAKVALKEKQAKNTQKQIEQKLDGLFCCEKSL